MDNTLVYREAGLSTGIIIIIIIIIITIIIIIILNKLVQAGLYTLKSVWVFSIRLSLFISYGTDKEKMYANQESLGDHFPYSCDLNVWFRSDVVRRIFIYCRSVKPTNRPTNNRRIETDQWLLTNSTWVFQPITSRLNRPITFNRPDFITSSTDNYSSLDSEDDFRTGCRNVSHQQQFFSELHSPRRSHYTNYWYSWVQTIYFTKENFVVSHSEGLTC